MTGRICAFVLALFMILMITACAKETTTSECGSNSEINIIENSESLGSSTETEGQLTESEVFKGTGDKVTDEKGDDDMFFKKELKEVPAKGEVAGIAYEVFNNYAYHYKSVEKGYLIDSFNSKDGSIYYVICSGRQRSGGYGICVTGIKEVNDTTVEITVTETAPGKETMVTMAITYPMCAVCFDKKPESVVIKDNLGNELNYIDNTK